MTKFGSRTVSLRQSQQKLCPPSTFLTFSPSRAPPSCHEPPYRCSARAWRRRWQQGPRGVPPHPRPRQELEARLAPSLSSSAQRTTSSTSPPPAGDNARSYAGSTCRRPGAQPSAPSEAVTRLPRVPGRAAPPIRHRRRARNATYARRPEAATLLAGSQCAELRSLWLHPTVPSAPVHDTGSVLPFLLYADPTEYGKQEGSPAPWQP